MQIWDDFGLHVGTQGEHFGTTGPVPKADRKKAGNWKARQPMSHFRDGGAYMDICMPGTPHKTLVGQKRDLTRLMTLKGRRICAGRFA